MECGYLCHVCPYSYFSWTMTLSVPNRERYFWGSVACFDMWERYLILICCAWLFIGQPLSRANLQHLPTNTMNSILYITTVLFKCITLLITVKVRLSPVAYFNLLLKSAKLLLSYITSSGMNNEDSAYKLRFL